MSTLYEVKVQFKDERQIVIYAENEEAVRQQVLGYFNEVKDFEIVSIKEASDEVKAQVEANIPPKEEMN